MKEEILDILCCPTCKGDLKLNSTEGERGEIISGSLTCKKCGKTYPIEDGIPNLLPK